MASTAGLAPAASTFAKWRSDLTELRGQVASVIGLAPIRPDLKGRLREHLCIRGRKSGPRGCELWNRRQRLLVFSEALFCLSYSGNYLSSLTRTCGGAPFPRSASMRFSDCPGKFRVSTLQVDLGQFLTLAFKRPEQRKCAAT